jgi:D-glycero-D-manno-heptose 1,7-bisphosphate phosphatase
VGIGSLSRAAVFLDRDGVLVEEVYYEETGEWEAPLCADHVRLRPGVGEGCRALAKGGYALVLVSNQGGYAKGKTSLRALWLAHERFVSLLGDEGVLLDAVYYSFSHPNGVVPHFTGCSLDRKPGPYSLFVAAAQHDLGLSRSWMIGDRLSDVHCARAAGVRAILMQNPRGPRDEDLSGAIRVSTMEAAVSHILAADAD